MKKHGAALTYEYPACIALALVLRLVFVLVLQPMLNTRLGLNYDANNYDADGYGHIADTILQMRYIDVERAPLYPAYVALMFALSHHSATAVKIGQAALDTGTVALIWKIGQRITPQSRVGSVGAWLYAVYPLAWWRCGFLYKEVLETFVLAAFMAFCVILPLDRGRSSVSGVLLGALNLVKPIFLGLPVLVGLWLWTRCRQQPSFARASWLWMVAGVAFLVLPWTARNYWLTGSFVPVAIEQAGKTAFVGNYYPALGAWEGPHKQEWEAALAEIAAQHPRASAPELDRAYLSAAVDEVTAQPAHFARMFLLKAWRFWFSNASGRLGAVVLAVQATFVGLGVVGVLRRQIRPHAAFLLIAVICYVWLLHAAVYADVRFSLPVMPYVVLFGAAALMPRTPVRVTQAARSA